MPRGGFLPYGIGKSTSECWSSIEARTAKGWQIGIRIVCHLHLFTISGSNWNIKDEFGTLVTTDQQFAILQFPVGMEPWRATDIYGVQPNVVDWSVTYTAFY